MAVALKPINIVGNRGQLCLICQSSASAEGFLTLSQIIVLKRLIGRSNTIAFNVDRGHLSLAPKLLECLASGIESGGALLEVLHCLLRVALHTR
jgi:hypothetical protein